MADDSFDIAPVEEIGAPANPVDDSFPLKDVPGDPVAPPLDPKDVATRAAKYDFALGDKSPGQDHIMSRIQSNMEDADRRKLAIDKTLQMGEVRNNMIKGLATQASDEGRNLTMAETNAAIDLSDLALTDASTAGHIGQAAGNVPGTLVQDPATIFEREYAQKVITNAINTGEDTPFNNSVYTDSEGTHTKLDIFQQVLTFKEAYQKQAAKYDAMVKDQSTLGYVADMTKGVIPGYSYFKTRNLLRDTPDINAYGGNMLDTVHAAYNGKPEQTVPQTIAKLDALAKDNPQLAAQVAHSLVDYPASSQLLDSLLVTGADIATVLPVGAMIRGLPKLSELATAGIKAAPDLATKAAGTARAMVTKEAMTDAKTRFSKLLSDIGSTVMKKDVTIPEVLDSAGQTIPSAATSIVDKIVAHASNLTDAGAVAARDLINELPGIFNAQEVTGGIRSTWATKMTSEALMDLLADADNGLKRLFLDPLRASKYGPETIKAATQVAANTFKLERRDLENSIMNVFENNTDKNLGDHQAVIHLGDPQAMGFETEYAAKNMAVLYGVDDASKVVPAGNGYAIQIQRPLDFTTDVARKGMQIDVKNNPTPWSNILGRVLTGLRSTDDILPKWASEKLKVGTYGASGLERMIMQSAKRISKLRDPNDFHQFIKSEMLERNPINPEKLGTMSRDPQEFEVRWSGKFNRLPSETEKTAYFSYRFINDMHYAGMNLGLFLDKNALGLSRLDIGLPGMVEGKISSLAEFQAVEDNARLLVLEDGVDPWSMTRKFGNAREGTEGPTYIERVTKLLDEGYVMSKITDTGNADLQRWLETDAKTNGRVHFILTKEVKTNPLSLRQVPYQAGIHNIMPDGHYIAQPDIYLNASAKKATYYGDINVAFAGNVKIAKDIADKLEQFRQMYRAIPKKTADPIGRANAIKEAREFAKKNLPFTWSNLRRDFSKKGRLHLDVPILYRASNQSLADAHPLADIFKDTQFVKHADSELNFYRGRVNLDFASQRGDPIREVVERGDPAAPLYGLRPANLIDPMAALDRGVTAMVRGRYFEPYKREIADGFLSEFGDLLNPSNKEQMLDPFRALRQLDFRENIQGEDLERLRQARSYAARVNQFFGNVNNQESKFYKYLGMKLIGGESPEAMSGMRKSLAEILTQGHPADILKKLAFYPKMGFWNPKQLLQQGNTYLNVVALAGPKIGSKAGVYSMLMRSALMDSKLVPEVAQMAKRMGFDADEFTRVIDAMDRTGFGKMGREVATREQHLEGSVVQTKLGAMMDHGLFFMKEGEEFVRRAAFSAAYLEKEAVKGSRKLTDQDIQAVLNRADFYNANMSHASNAAWQQGFASIPTQFWSYQVRMMEQLMGKRMTNAERARILGSYAAIYGIPIGVTTAMPIWPVHETIKEYLISNNINTDDNTIVKVLNDGIASNLVQMVTGEDTNIENVYGPSGIPLLKDLYDGKKSVFDAVFGASGNVLFNTLAAVSPAIGWIGTSIMGNEREPIKPQDFIDVISNITSLSMMEKMYIAATTQKYLTKYGQSIASDDSTARMLFNITLGIQPQAIDDMYRTMQVNESYDAYTKKLNRWVQEDIRNGLSSTNEGDRADWFKRARVKSTWFPNALQADKAIYAAVTENKDLIERARQAHARTSAAAADFEVAKRKTNGAQ